LIAFGLLIVTFLSGSTILPPCSHYRRAKGKGTLPEQRTSLPGIYSTSYAPAQDFKRKPEAHKRVATFLIVRIHGLLSSIFAPARWLRATRGRRWRSQPARREQRYKRLPYSNGNRQSYNFSPYCKKNPRGFPGPPTLATRSPVHPIALEIDAVQGEPLRRTTLERLLLPVHAAFLPWSFQDVPDAAVLLGATLVRRLQERLWAISSNDRFKMQLGAS
jgi:hypothetical protein